MAESLRRRRVRLLLLALLVFSLSGCWDRREIEDVALVLTLGLDSAGEKKVRITVQVAVPRAIQSGTVGNTSGGDAPPALVESIESATVTQGLRDLETFMNRRVSFMHLKAVVFGRSLAGRGLTTHLGPLTRNREFRRTLMLIVSDTTAEEALTLMPVLEREPALYLEDLTRRAHERTARAPRVNLHDFLISYESLASEPMLPILSAKATDPGLQGKGGPKKGRLLGTAVFRGDQMVGELTDTETEMALLLSGQVRRFLELLPTPDGRHYIALDVSLQGRKISVDPTGRVPTATINIKLEADIREIEQGGAELITDEGLRRMARQLEQGLKERADKVLAKLQGELHSDILGLGEGARLRFLDWDTWVRYNWPEQFPKAKVAVRFTAKVRRVGMTFQPAEER